MVLPPGGSSWNVYFAALAGSFAAGRWGGGDKRDQRGGYLRPWGSWGLKDLKGVLVLCSTAVIRCIHKCKWQKGACPAKLCTYYMRMRIRCMYMHIIIFGRDVDCIPMTPKCWNNFGTIFLGHTPPLSSHMCHGEKLDCIWFYTGRWPSIIISPWMISTVGWYSCYSHRTLKGSCNAAMLLQPWWPRWRKGAGAKPPHWDLMIWSTNFYSNFDIILGQLPQSKINRRGLLMGSWHCPTEGCSTRFVALQGAGTR